MRLQQRPLLEGDIDDFRRLQKLIGACTWALQGLKLHSVSWGQTPGQQDQRRCPLTYEEQKKYTQSRNIRRPNESCTFPPQTRSPEILKLNLLDSKPLSPNPKPQTLNQPTPSCVQLEAPIHGGSFLRARIPDQPAGGHLRGSREGSEEPSNMALVSTCHA